MKTRVMKIDASDWDMAQDRIRELEDENEKLRYHNAVMQSIMGQSKLQVLLEESIPEGLK